MFWYFPYFLSEPKTLAEMEPECLDLEPEGTLPSCQRAAVHEPVNHLDETVKPNLSLRPNCTLEQAKEESLVCGKKQKWLHPSGFVAQPHMQLLWLLLGTGEQQKQTTL